MKACRIISQSCESCKQACVHANADPPAIVAGVCSEAPVLVACSVGKRPNDSQHVLRQHRATTRHRHRRPVRCIGAHPTIRMLNFWHQRGACWSPARRDKISGIKGGPHWWWRLIIWVDSRNICRYHNLSGSLASARQPKIFAATILRPEISLRFHLCLRCCQCCLVGGVQFVKNVLRSGHICVLGWRWDHVTGYARCGRAIWDT
jgi:hypothetical protein